MKITEKKRMEILSLSLSLSAPLLLSSYTKCAWWKNYSLTTFVATYESFDEERKKRICSKKFCTKKPLTAAVHFIFRLNSREKFYVYKKETVNARFARVINWCFIWIFLRYLESSMFIIMYSQLERLIGQRNRHKHTYTYLLAHLLAHHGTEWRIGQIWNMPWDNDRSYSNSK